MLDLQHIPNVKDGKRLIKGFDIKRSITIAIPSNEHMRIKYVDYSDVGNARSLLSKEIKMLRSHTEIPVVVLLKIIEANKKRYPESYKK